MASESVVKRPALDGFVLPYGFVQSPILASLALDKSRLGSYLRTLDGRKDLSVSLYVDDIILSSDDERALSAAADQLCETADAALFPINSSKTYGPAIGIEAFNIALSHEALRITDARLAEFRNDYLAATSEFAKAGIMNYVSSVNLAQAREVLDQAREVLESQSPATGSD